MNIKIIGKCIKSTKPMLKPEQVGNSKAFIVNDEKEEYEEYDVEEVTYQEISNMLTSVKEKLEKLIQKKMACNKTKSIFAMKQKLLNYLINLGYDYDMILLNLNSIQLDNQKVIQKEYQKLFQRLSKKYQNEELNYQIKNRLYAKGFSTYEIQNVIKNGD